MRAGGRAWSRGATAGGPRRARGGRRRRRRQVGDEPLLIRRRTGVPVWVGRDRVAAALGLCAAHPDVDVLVSDDGLQHHRLARDAELVVFDERGAGNGLLLPAGPLRQRTAAQAVVAHAHRLHRGAASTALPGALALRALGTAWPLAGWSLGRRPRRPTPRQPAGPPLLAVAGLAAPEKFFAMLRAAGLAITPLPLPDHHAYDTLPWPPETPDVDHHREGRREDRPRAHREDPGLGGAARLALPAALVGELLQLLPATRRPP